MKLFLRGRREKKKREKSKERAKTGGSKDDNDERRYDDRRRRGDAEVYKVGGRNARLLETTKLLFKLPPRPWQDYN